MEKITIYSSKFERKNNCFVVRLQDGRIGYIEKEEMTIYPFKKSSAQINSYLGKKFSAKIVKEENNKIFLSRKEVMQERLEEILNGGAIGKILDAQIISASEFAFYVDLGEMISGIIYKNDIINASFNLPTDIYPIGKTIKVKITSYKNKGNFFTLSHKNVFSKNLDQYYTGMRLDGIIRSPIYDGEKISGYFVQITPAISGIVDVNNIHLDNGDVIPMVIKDIKARGLKLRLQFPN